MKAALYVAWRSSDDVNGQWGPVGRLEHADGAYVFSYTKGAERLPGFRPLVGMPDLSATYRSDELFPVFANRLLTRSRRDYDAYLRWSGFDPNVPPDAISLLGVTEGRRETDALEVFPCPRPDSEGIRLNKFFVHGVRQMPEDANSRFPCLEVGEELGLLPETTNGRSQDAMAVQAIIGNERRLIGYLPRYLANDVRALLRDGPPDVVIVTVERVNLDAPLRHRLLCRLRSSWPDGSRPCSDERFDLIEATKIGRPEPVNAFGVRREASMS